MSISQCCLLAAKVVSLRSKVMKVHRAQRVKKKSLRLQNNGPSSAATGFVECAANMRVTEARGCACRGVLLLKRVVVRVKRSLG